MIIKAIKTRLKKEHPEGENNIVPRYLAVVVLFTLCGMTIFEILQIYAHDYIDELEAHVLTILFSTALSGSATYFALHQYTKLNKRLAYEIETRKKLEQDLIVAATIDKLTQIYNRRKLEAIIETEIERAKRYNRPLSLIMLDIDDFKRVNDTYGHQVGDNVLKELANILKNNIRVSDTAGRWGGEEFMIVVPETAANNAWELAEKIRNLIASSSFAGSCIITISLGLAQLQPGDNFDSFLKRVDDALYQAKSRGKNRVEALY